MPYDFNLKTKDNHLMIGEFDANDLAEEFNTKSETTKYEYKYDNEYVLNKHIFIIHEF